ncbi:molybdopterin synthase sulfur carrier subunit [bacterium]|nr:molybdopterin synthase sulfur carrier subunit [bacterium]
MIIRIKLFALAQDLAGAEEVTLDVAPGATIETVREALANQVPELKSMLVSCAFAINNEYATTSSPVEPEDEIACLPPVSGG